ncbi:hypothetical protein [Pseudodesulfovibrio pelocollis]|uniref:hypothetical protein n=1 Tax=Pseudodesulfovibrio pelocollis TaxID=3051432 RepID=UPI00255AAA96|nr:hypothetical protein [Pseudodesulfovibrio sp. SB368]
MFLSTGTTDASSLHTAAPPPFSGLGHALEAAEVIALAMRPHWDVHDQPEAIPIPPPKAHGYGLLLALSREIRGR